MSSHPPHPSGSPQSDTNALALPATLRAAKAAYGRRAWEEAEALCRRMLEANADAAGALDLLGMIAAQTQRTREAAELFGRAVAVSPADEWLRFHQGIALQQLGRLEAALESYEQAIRLRPGFAEAHNNRGSVLQGLGRRDMALESYGQAIRLKPEFVDAYYNRGNLLKEMGRADEALESYARAIQLKPDFATAWINRGGVLQEMGRLAEALDSYDGALRIEPESAEALYNRGSALQALGRLPEALASYDSALALRPGYAEACNNRGIVLQTLTRVSEALESYDRALALKPDFTQAHSNRGIALQALGRLEEALQSHDRALAQKPDSAEAFYNRGNALQALGRFTDALASYDCALQRKPDHADAFYNRGSALQALGQLAEALASLERSIAINPDLVNAHSRRGNVLRELRRYDEAIASHDRAIAIRPDLAEAHANRGSVLTDLGRYGDALASFDQAILIEPDLAEAHSNRGSVLVALKRYDDAAASYEKAISINPDSPYLFGSWLHARMQICDWNGFDKSVDQLIRAVEAGKKVASPFEMLAIPSSSAQQQRCARIYSDDKYPAHVVAAPKGERVSRDRIRLGYFSSDFRDHPVSHLTAGLFESHDRSRFEVLAFSLSRPSDDPMQQRLRKAFDRFIDCGQHSDRDIALLAREMELDIAVDLSGYTLGERTGVFAMRAAPTQVNYLGYPGTMGAEYIDYIIADKTVIPLDRSGDYSEQVVHLPCTFQVNDRTKIISNRRLDRRELGLPEEGFVFCCFNNNFKITPDIFAVWMRLLRQVSGSVLWLFEGAPAVVFNLRREAQEHGISPDRVVFARKMERADYLAEFRLADLFLDTWHYNAGTTASDALWVGLPVLTVLGRAFAGRMAASLLSAIGLEEMIASSHSQYEALALALANDRGRLATIKEKLGKHRTTSPLFDTALFTRHIEAAYHAMFERHRAGLRPHPIVVEA